MTPTRDQYGWHPDAEESWLADLLRDLGDQIWSLGSALRPLALGLAASMVILAVLILIMWLVRAGYRKVNRDFRDAYACPECKRDMIRLHNPWGPLVLTCDHGVEDPYRETPFMSRGDAIAADMKKGGHR